MSAKSIVSALGGAFLLATSVAAFADGNGGRAGQDVPVGSLGTGTQKVFQCRAAINSNGTIAGGASVASAALLGTSSYQVIFSGNCTNITSVNGWTHWVQVHTLTTGSIDPNVTCTLADRAGNPNGVFVNCTAPTSFFLSVEKP